MDQHFRTLMKEFMAEGVEPDYARLQWMRGCFAGMKFVLDYPTIEATKLERLLAGEQDDLDDTERT
jgi:hypothetical protein